MRLIVLFIVFTFISGVRAQDIDRLIDKELAQIAVSNKKILGHLTNKWPVRLIIPVSDGYDYIIARSEQSDSMYFGLASASGDHKNFKWTWGLVTILKKSMPVICGNMISVYAAAPPKKILPLKYYYSAAFTAWYYGEQHEYPVHIKRYMKYNENGTAYMGYQLGIYQVAPLEEAANHYTGGSFGRLTGGFSYYTNAELQLNCSYKFDNRPYNSFLVLNYNGTKKVTGPTSKLDLSKEKLENLSNAGNYKQRVIAQIKSDFPTNFYVKQTKKGFKEVMNAIAEDVKEETVYNVLYMDNSFLLLHTIKHSEYDLSSYEFLYTDPGRENELNQGFDICFPKVFEAINYVKNNYITH